MTWLRIDDAVAINGKIGRLTDREFRALVALWSLCAREQDSGTFTLDDLPYSVYATPQGPRTTTVHEIRKLCSLGLVDPLDDPLGGHAAGHAYRIHDWFDYQPKDPTAAQRKQRQRDRERENDEPGA